ncbi:MAG: hypothetical protein N2652_04320 [Kiritimatiellae bacterium]|nr:hypothetical protein [Kiritimatiellia bacterium]
MKPEYLDALLIDRALGELPAEVGELLEAYLEHEPSARAAADSWERFVAEAGAAVRAIPPAPARTARGARRLAACAAAVALAIAALAAWGPWKLRDRTPAVRGAVWAAYEVSYDPVAGGFAIVERRNAP